MIWTVRTSREAPRDLGIVNEHTLREAEAAAEENPAWYRIELNPGVFILRTLPLYVCCGETQQIRVEGE